LTGAAADPGEVTLAAVPDRLGFFDTVNLQHVTWGYSTNTVEE